MNTRSITSLASSKTAAYTVSANMAAGYYEVRDGSGRLVITTRTYPAALKIADQYNTK